ncbi:peptidylprolyl isomerase [Lacibacter sediminis]|uniref:Periplasmic chaperone PpiD n=1 Tax=Lacibacter sediminis TaxID=2760713 RepID=A0A7G5XGM5_9BACT|nr:peptidylprolyl isomerase [Lacibacter sediminis]QNA44628.1 SurA N-terminal domain-containing protein [Lacibacter sediminis]
MSIIQQIREKYAAVSIAVIALSLIGFILTDYFAGRGSGAGSQPTSIGSVNGKDIDVNVFSDRLTEMENGYRAQGMDVNDEMRQQLIEMLWSNEVEETILTAEYEKLGLTFSSADMNEALYGSNPPPALAQQFRDQQTGAYDVNAARQFINSLKNKKANDPQRVYVERNIIDYIVQNGLRTKYGALLAGSVFYPKWLSDKDLNDQSSIASISYVAVPYTTISDSAVKVTDEDINTYVRKHKNEFKQEESRAISYVIFDAAPSAADSAYALGEVNKQYSAFATSTDAEQFILANSSTTAFYNGYVLKSALQVPNADSIRNLPVGGVFGPYQDGGNYVIAKMVAKRDIPDSVKCRHILVGVMDQQTGQAIMSDSAALKLIDSIKNAVNGGANWGEMVKKYNPLSDGSRENNGEMTFSANQVQQPNFAKEFADFILLDGKVGERKVVKTSFGYHYIEIMEQKKIEPAYKVAYFSRAVQPSDETISTASTAAAQFAAEARNAKQFEEAITKKKLVPRVAEIRPTDYSIIGLGGARNLVKWVYENKVGNVSEPTTLGDKVVVALIAEEKEEGIPDAKTARIQVESIVRNQKKAAEIVGKIGNNRDLNQIATSFKTNVLRADSISFFSPFIPGVGMEPKVTGAAFNPAVKGKSSEPIAGNTAVFVIRTENVGLQPAGNAAYIDRRLQMEGGMKQNAANAALQALRKAAKVKDRRIKFY